MDDKALISLFELFQKSDAAEMKYAANGTVFEVRRKEAFAALSAAALQSAAAQIAPVDAGSSTAPAAGTAPAAHVVTQSIPETVVPAAHAPCAGKAGAGCEIVKSPIVGTFYRAASPDAPPFAEVGKKIGKNQKLCIIEAMKMMNALESEFDCVVEKILVNNGDLVEFDQPLFEVRKV